MNGELWYHPSYGVVAFNAPAVGIGTVMTDTSDCGSVDSSGYRTIRKVAVVDSSSSFNLDTYDCDGNQFAADANTHAQMLLELRWVDETQAKTDSEPSPNVEFGVASGNYFTNSITESPTSIFHPEENGKGFKYWYSYVSQADKNEQIVSTAYHITVGAVPGLSAVRVTARIYYKVIPSLVGASPDASTAGGKPDSGVDATASDGPSGVFGTIVLDPVASGDLSNWTPPAVNSNPTMTFEEIVSPYDSGVALRTTATGTTLMACPVEYTSRDFQLPGSISSAAYALQLYLALDSNMTTYNWPGLQVDLLSGGVAVADIQYYRAAATGDYIMQRTANWHAIADNGFQTLPLSPLLDSNSAVISTPVTFDKIRITMVNYTCVGTNSVIIDALSLVPTNSNPAGGSRDSGVDATVSGGGRDGAGATGDVKDSSTTDAVAGKTDVGADASGTGGAAGSGQETILFKMESVEGVSYNPPQITTFTLTTASYITRVWTYHYAATIGTKSPTVAFKDTTSGTVYGPWAQVGYYSFAGTLGATRSDPGNILGPPDNYWMAYPGQSVPAGTYQVIDSDPTTWAYTSDLGNRGVTWVYGYSLSGGGRDGGIDQAQSDAGARADAKDSSVADSPTDSSGGETGGSTGCNLIVNGNAEAAIGSADGTPVSTPGWTSVGEATAIQYGVSGWPAPTDPGPADRGLNFFSGGQADATSSLTQTIDVSQYASSIDASHVTYVVSGWLGGWSSQDDNATLTVTFQNASGAALGTGSIGPVMSSDRSGVTGFVQQSSSGAVPSGTRTVLVALSMARTEGVANDGYADDLSLVFSGTGASAGACNLGTSVDGGSTTGSDGSSTCGIGSAPAPVGTFDDDFSLGLRSAYWSVTQTTAGLYSVDSAQGDVRLAKVGTNSAGILQNVVVNLNIQNVGGPVAGDFELSVDIANAVLGSGGTDQIELHASFDDSSYFYDVYDNSSGVNVHVWTGSLQPGFSTTATAGTFKIARTGATISAYFNTALVWSSTWTTGRLVGAAFVLQLQANSDDNESVRFDNFHLKGGCVSP
jgi:hypothetical protein